MEMKKRILAVILSAMMMASSFPVNAAELEVVYVSEETNNDQSEIYDDNVTDTASNNEDEELSNSEDEETEKKENKAADDAEYIDQESSESYIDINESDESDEENSGESGYSDDETAEDSILTGTDPEEESLSNEIITEEATEEESLFTDEWLKEHGLTVNDEGMFEYVDEYGELWIYNPEDPEFWKYFVETDRDYVGLNEDIEEEQLLTSGEQTYTDPFTCTITGKRYKYPSYIKTSSDAESVPVRYGMDVSYHQGKITASAWQAMKDEYEVDFAFIRAGFRGYGQSGSLNSDDKFSTNIRNAYNAGIKAGVYFFSQAISESEAVDEADYCLKLIGSNIDLVTLPIIIDYEYSGSPGRLKGANLSPSKHTAIVNAFCNRIREKGHSAGIYANKSMFLNDMVFSSIDSKNYIWMAHWPSSSDGVYATNFGERLNCWQFTDAFTGFGTNGTGYMGNKVLDLDFWFGKFPDELTGELKYDANGGIGEEALDVEKIGKTVTLKECQYTKEGCSFKEWNTKASGNGKSYYPGDEYTISETTHKLFAIWEYNEYTLVFDPQGGAVDVTEKTVLFNGKPYGELPIADMDGFHFLGWFTDAEGGKEVTSADVLPEAKNQTLYAHWEKIMPQSVSLSYDAIRMEEGSTKKLLCSISPSGTQTPVTWKSSDETVATVSDGVVTAVGPGTATITVMTGDVPLSANCVVTVFSNDVKNDEEVIGGDSFEIPDGIWLAGFKEEIIYTGSKITQPDVRVYSGSNLLRAGTDYSVSYKNNLNAGEAVMTVQGKGNYSGKVTRTFTISPITLFTELEEGEPAKDEVDIAVGVVNKGKPVKPAVTVTHEGKVLKKDKDYTLEYDEITDSRKGNVIIRGKGNYQGFTIKEFVVKDAAAPNISKAAVVGLKKSYTLDELANGNIEEVLDGISLTYKKDVVDRSEYIATFENVNAVGKGTLVITPTKNGDFSGSKRVTFNVTGNKLGSVVLSETSFAYNGMSQKPEIQVYSGKKGEGEYIDPDCYSISYSSDCIKAGTVTVTVTGKASKGYTGKLTAKYSIKPLPVADAISAGIIKVPKLPDMTYVQGGASPNPLVIFTDGNGKDWTLKQDLDYSVKYANNKSTQGAKEPSLTITGKGNFTGKSKALPFAIEKRDISSLAVTCKDVAANSKKKGSYYYSKPVITDVNGKALKEKTDYTVTYTKASGSAIGKNEVIYEGTLLKAVITAAGKNYSGTTTAIYKVTKEPKDISKASVSKIANRMYTGKPVEVDSNDSDFKLTFTTGSGSPKIVKNLEEGKDFVITGYYNNIKKGTASMRIEGRGEYSGSKIITFKIISSAINSTDL